MTIKSRLRTIERRHGRPVDRQLVVLWPRGDEERTRRRVERARRLGWRVRVVRYGIAEFAGDAAVAATKLSGLVRGCDGKVNVAISSHRDGAVLAASVAVLPDWLSGRSAAGAPS